MLGRPLGVPDDPTFQRKVLLAALRLFEMRAGPVLREFVEEAPDVALESPETGGACPVNFAAVQSAGEGTPAAAQALAQEISQLRPWHDLAVARRGGSSGGLSGLSAEAAAAFVLAFLSGQAPASHRPQQPFAQTLKQVCDDLRTFYEEAASVQPGALSPGALESWLYFGTVLGEVLRKLHLAGRTSTDPGVRAFAERTLLPRSVLHRVQASEQR